MKTIKDLNNPESGDTQSEMSFDDWREVYLSLEAEGVRHNGCAMKIVRELCPEHAIKQDLNDPAYAKDYADWANADTDDVECQHLLMNSMRGYPACADCGEPISNTDTNLASKDNEDCAENIQPLIEEYFPDKKVIVKGNVITISNTDTTDDDSEDK